MIIYYIDGKKYTTDDEKEISWNNISSPDENTPAAENLKTGENLWCLKGDKWHRLTGPAYIWVDYAYGLNGKRYYNIHDWLKDHPNQSNAFQIEMLLKHT
jgi:hypothetical protein